MAVLTFALAAILSGQQSVLRHIDFFGYEGFDIASIRNALPFHEGDGVTISKALGDEWKREGREVVRRLSSKDPTDIAIVSYEGANLLVYIGLPGKSASRVKYNPVPTGHARLPPNPVKLHEEMENALINAVEKGATGADNSNGYTLSTDPALRANELALREYAVQNGPSIIRVLASASDPVHRAIAATALGYARQTDEQVAALVNASFDPDSAVRNNAVRALAVLVEAKPEAGRRIPADRFIDLLRSGLWTDRNKAGFLLLSLTKSRDPALLGQLRSQALAPLLEMARWGTAGHAYFARILLGRIAGIEEGRLSELVQAGQVDAILREFQ